MKLFYAFPDKSTLKQRLTVIINTLLGKPFYYTVTDEEAKKLIQRWSK